MCQPSIGVLCRDQNVAVNLKGELDGLKTFEDMYDLMPAVGCVDRLILNFSDIARVKSIELYYLLAELATEPRFSDIEISIEGLKCDRMDKYT